MNLTKRTIRRRKIVETIFQRRIVRALKFNILEDMANPGILCQKSGRSCEMQVFIAFKCTAFYKFFTVFVPNLVPRFLRSDLIALKMDKRPQI